VPEDEGRQDAPHGASPAPDGPPPEQPDLSPWSSPAPDAPPPPGSGDPFATEPLRSSSLPPDAGSDQPYGPPPPAPYGSPYGSPPASPYGPPQGQGGAPGYGPPPYGAPPGPPTAYGPGYGAAGYGYGGPRTSSNATVVLVCGIASIVLLFTCGLGFIPAIVALVRAPSARREIIASNGQLSGLGMVTAGRITAWTTIGLTILAIVGVVLLITIGNMFDSSTDFGNDGFSASAR
jgi:hypothetical protein